MRKISGHSGLYKTETGAVITRDHKLYEHAKKKIEDKKRLENLENKMNRIEELLEKLVNGS